MKSKKDTTDDRFASALEAISNLLLPELNQIVSGGWSAALAANSEINIRPITLRSGVFHTHLAPLLKELVSALAGAYRRYFKLALAHPGQVGDDPNDWALAHLRPFVIATIDWLRDWYMLACDGSNRYMQLVGSVPFEKVQPGQKAKKVTISIPVKSQEIASPKSWRAPAWLFEVGAMVGIGLLKTENVPATDSEEKLSAAHTRLLLKGVRKIFLGMLRAAIKTVRNEEIAAAGAIPAEILNRDTRRPNKRKGWEQREKLYEAIRKTLNGDPSLQGIEFCSELDKRHAPPLFDWVKRGDWREGLTWKEAWADPLLRERIRRVRQEAMKDR
jgi:hypothetical protein